MVAWVTASLPAVVLLPTPETFGVEPEEVAAISATLSRAILQTTATPPLVGVAIDEGCLGDTACVQARLIDNGADAAIVINIIRSGEMLDVRERLYRRDGALALEQRRRSTMPLFEATPLSTELVAAIGSAPTMTTTMTTTPTPTPTPGSTVVVPPGAGDKNATLPVSGLATAAVGGAFAIAGGAAFAVGAATVGNADSAGADKELAYVYGWAGLVGVLVGTAAAAVGVAMSVGALP